MCLFLSDGLMFSHFGSTFDYRSICEGGLMEGIGVQEGRQTCCFTAVGAMEISMLTPRYEPIEPRTIPYKSKWWRMHNAVFWFDLRPAQNKGMVCWQTITCGLNTLTQDFFSTLSSLCTHHIVAQGVARRVCMSHVHPHVITCLSVCCFLVLSSSSVSRASTFSTSSPSWTSTPMLSRLPSIRPNAHPQNEEYCPVAIYNPLTGYEPNQLDNQLDNFDYPETYAAIFQDEPVDMDTEPSYSCDAELDDELIGQALSSPLCIQEREEPANLRQTYHSHEESLLPAQSFFTRTSTEKTVHEHSSCQKRKWSREMENERIRILLERQKEQILAVVRSEIQKHELQAESDKRSIQELTGIIDSQRMEIDHTIAGCEQSKRDQLLHQEELSEPNRDLRETRIKSLHEMEELKRVQELQVDEFSRRRLIEHQVTINELTARIQELHNEVNCMNDSRDFKDVESVRSGQSHVTSQPGFFPPHQIPEGMLSRSTGMPSRKEGPPSIWNSQGISGNVFANPRASSSSPHPGEFNPWISNVTEDTPVLTSTGGPVTCGERQIPDTVLNPRFQTGRSLDPKEEDSQRIMVPTNNDCRFRIFTLTNSLLQQHLLVGR